MNVMKLMMTFKAKWEAHVDDAETNFIATVHTVFLHRYGISDTLLLKVPYTARGISSMWLKSAILVFIALAGVFQYWVPYSKNVVVSWGWSVEGQGITCYTTTILCELEKGVKSQLGQAPY